MKSLLEQLREALAPQYEIEREIASGGMGTVLLARDTVLDRKVAIKVHKPDLAIPNAAKRLAQEARILARLKHPNVVSVYNAGEIGESFYYIMDYVEGETLAARLERGPLPTEEVLKLGGDLLAALAAAHSHGIVHRDVKPGNIFLVEDRALLGDFGIAKHGEDSGSRITEPGHRLGTPGYMSPEQVAGESVTSSADVYAVGMLLYEALTGRRWSVLTQAQEGDWSGVPADVAQRLQDALAWSPDDRPDAGTLRERLLGTSRPEPPKKKKAIVWAAAVAAVGIVLGGGWALGRLAPRSVSTVSATSIAVLPFTVRGSGEFAYLGEGMVDLLSTKLDGAGNLRSADPRAVLSLVAQEGGALPDPEQGRRIAGGLGAGLYVLGNVVEVQGRLHLDASLYDPDLGADAIAQASAEGDADRIFDLVDQLAAELLAGQAQGPHARVTRIAAVTTNSLPALKAYLQGEHEFRAGNFVPAAEAFQRATEADSTFALAWYRLAIVGDWLFRSELVESSAEQAVRHDSRLSEHDRRLLEASLAARRGDAAESERLYLGILGTYSDDVEAWFQLAETQFHFGPFYGRSVSESRDAFERVLAFEPNEVHALTHLIRIAAAEGERSQLDALVSRSLELGPEADRALEVRVIREAVLGNARSQQQLLVDLRDAEVDPALIAVWSVPVFTGNFDYGEELASALLEPSRAPDVRALGHMFRASLRLTRGRWRAAQTELEAASALAPAAALELRGLLSAVQFLSLPSSELEGLVRELRDWKADLVRPSATPTTWVSVHHSAHPHVRLYLLALLSMRLQEDSAALGYADELAALDGPDYVTATARDLASGIRAQSAWGRGRLDDAVALMDEIRMQTWYQRMGSSLFYSQAHERYARALILAASVREREAITWLNSFNRGSLFDLVYLAPSHLKRGQIYERLGERDEALRHYSRFVELWEDADPELQPQVAAARRAIDAMSAQP